MYHNHMAKELVILLGSAFVVAFAVNFFSPSGIALVGQWDEAQGVVMARAKNDVVVGGLEIDDVKTAKQIYDSGTALFVDVRSREDYDDGHIKGAVSFPVGRFDAFIDAFKDQYSTDSIIIIYCSGRTCDDSHELAQLLFEQGYTTVSVFIDGYPGWEAEGYPIE